MSRDLRWKLVFLKLTESLVRTINLKFKTKLVIWITKAICNFWRDSKSICLMYANVNIWSYFSKEINCFSIIKLSLQFCNVTFKSFTQIWSTTISLTCLTRLKFAFLHQFLTKNCQKHQTHIYLSFFETFFNGLDNIGFLVYFEPITQKFLKSFFFFFNFIKTTEEDTKCWNSIKKSLKSKK